MGLVLSEPKLKDIDLWFIEYQRPDGTRKKFYTPYLTSADARIEAQLLAEKETYWYVTNDVLTFQSILGSGITPNWKMV